MRQTAEDSLYHPILLLIKMAAQIPFWSSMEALAGAFSAVCVVTIVVLVPVTLSTTDRSNGMRKPIAMIIGGILVAAFFLGLVVGQIDAVPYNIRELIGKTRGLTPVILAIILIALGAVPFVAAREWLIRPRRFALAVAPLVCLLGLITFGMLFASVPLESIDDIVGTPIWNIGATLERSVRFVALCGGVIACLTTGVRIPMRVFDRGFWLGLIVIAVIGAISYALVVPFAATDNLIELLRNFGKSIVVVGLPMILVLSGIAAVVAAAGIQALVRRQFILPLVSVALVAAVVILNWDLLVAATNPRLEKYGQVFSARQFLFSADREHYLPDLAIFLRFVVAETLWIALLSSGILAAAAWTSTQLKVAGRHVTDQG